MSKEKTPQAKKASSLKRDRRNRYGENSKSSRKNIARGKQISHQRERRAVGQDLSSIEQSPTEDSASAVENKVKTTERRLKFRRFKKVPDQPLGTVIEERRVSCEPFLPGSVDDLGRPVPTPAPRATPKLRSRIMYIESKAEGLTGPARIGRVLFSKTGSTLYYAGRSFRSLKGRGFKANYYDIATGEHYWISGLRKDGKDRLYDGGSPVPIDDDVWAEYWSEIRKTSPPAKRLQNKLRS
jgi:hypothetical protein